MSSNLQSSRFNYVYSLRICGFKTTQQRVEQTDSSSQLWVPFSSSIVCILAKTSPGSLTSPELCLLSGAFSQWKSGVLCLSSGVAPLLHPALPQSVFFFLPQTWGGRLTPNKTPAGAECARRYRGTPEEQRDTNPQSSLEADARENMWRYLVVTVLEARWATGKDGEDTHSHVPRFGFAGNFLSPCVGERRATGGGGGGEVLSGRLRPLFCPGQVSVRYYLWLCYFLLAALCHATAQRFGNAERISPTVLLLEHNASKYL